MTLGTEKREVESTDEVGREILITLPLGGVNRPQVDWWGQGGRNSCLDHSPLEGESTDAVGRRGEVLPCASSEHRNSWPLLRSEV